jgi:hypothetical protein
VAQFHLSNRGDCDFETTTIAVHRGEVGGDGGTFSELEWTVVALSRKDRLSTLRDPERVSAVLASIFGPRYDPRLANPKLEALRRIAVLSWRYGIEVHGGEVQAFINAGYTPDQYELLVMSTKRSSRPSHSDEVSMHPAYGLALTRGHERRGGPSAAEKALEKGANYPDRDNSSSVTTQRLKKALAAAFSISLALVLVMVMVLPLLSCWSTLSRR